MKFNHFLISMALMLFSLPLVAQPLYQFSVKLGIDRATVDTLGGEENVRNKAKLLFERIDNAFNNGQLEGIYHFEIDWDAFFIYEGSSADYLSDPHPDHDVYVLMDGLHDHESENQGGGWYGSDIQTIYHTRYDKGTCVSDPFDAVYVTDAIIHEFGHERGVPDIYAMKVDAKNNPVNGQRFGAVLCRMNQCYNVTHWSDYAVHIMNLSANKVLDGDDIVRYAFPKQVEVKVVNADGEPVQNAVAQFYPVEWYSYTVNPQSVMEKVTDKKGRILLPGNPYGEGTDVIAHIRYPLYLVSVTDGVHTDYGWLPIYEIQNAFFESKDTYTLTIPLKEGTSRYTKPIVK